MADINGLVKRRVDLVAATEQTILFEGGIQSISIAKLDSGNVAYKFNAVLADIDDDESNILTDDIPVVAEYERYRVTSLSLLSDANMTVQWDI